MTFNEHEIREVLLGAHDAKISSSFIEQYSEDCEAFISVMTRAFQYFHRLDGKLSKVEYGAYLANVAYATLSNHVLSFRLILLGCFVPAGNLQRHVLEYIALALLGSDRELPMFKDYIKNKYSASKAIDHVIRHHKRLNLNKIELRKLKDASKFYDKYSHPTLLTLAWTMTRNENGPGIVLGGIYDESKQEIYDKEIKSRVSLAHTFENFLEGIEHNAGKWLPKT